MLWLIRKELTPNNTIMCSPSRFLPAWQMKRKLRRVKNVPSLPMSSKWDTPYLGMWLQLQSIKQKWHLGCFQKLLLPARALSCCCGGSMKVCFSSGILAFQPFLFQISAVCSLVETRRETYYYQGRDILLASLQTVKSHKVKFRATRSGRVGVQGFLAVHSRWGLGRGRKARRPLFKWPQMKEQPRNRQESEGPTQA